MSEAKHTHTPTPWQRKGFTVFAQRNPGGRKMFICDVAQDAGAAVSPANAAFIVRAVNAHDALLAALRQANAQLVEWLTGSNPHNCTENTHAILDNIRKAIAKAEGVKS